MLTPAKVKDSTNTLIMNSVTNIHVSVADFSHPLF